MFTTEEREKKSKFQRFMSGQFNSKGQEEE